MVIHHHHKILLAFIAGLLVTGLALFAWNRPTKAPEKRDSDQAQPTSSPATTTALNTAKVVDLTYNFDDQTIYWPTAQPFKWEKEAWGRSAAGWWYTAGRYSASEHGGTHVDAPIHFGEGKASMDELPLQRLIGPVSKIDIRKACDQDRDYRLTVADIRAWEKDYGPLPAGNIVLVQTGWGQFWPDKKRYLGTAVKGDTANLHFPGISKEAAEFLAQERKVNGVGIDTASLDYGQTKDFIAHQVLNGANIYGLENVAFIERVPPIGATIIALPMKIKGGTGGPVRIVALLP
ncbi:MAG: cyclase family protein [Acidobacteria bacterium]|nr:cyclase family protein [Acidobacteriota bacterium]MBI3423148.1 cyclase family protein [Acidobacteriota bacterium]